MRLLFFVENVERAHEVAIRLMAVRVFKWWHVFSAGGGRRHPIVFCVYVSSPSSSWRWEHVWIIFDLLRPNCSQISHISKGSVTFCLHFYSWTRALRASRVKHIVVVGGTSQDSHVSNKHFFPGSGSFQISFFLPGLLTAFFCRFRSGGEFRWSIQRWGQLEQTGSVRT